MPDIVFAGVGAVGVIFGIYMSMTGRRQKDSTQLTTVIVKLESIGTGIADIKSDMRNMKETQQADRERLIVVEQAVERAHSRLDICASKCNKMNNA